MEGTFALPPTPPTFTPFEGTTNAPYHILPVAIADPIPRWEDPYLLIKYRTTFPGAEDLDYDWLTQAHSGEWIDLRLARQTTLSKGEFAYLDLGVIIQLPEGYEAIMAPRSSTFKNYGILQTNGIGVIDNTYCGENDIWKMPALAMRDTTIEFGTRIAQFKIVPHMPPIALETDLKVGTTQGRNGLGSTGRI